MNTLTTQERKARKIVVGDRFKASSGEIWTITEDLRFGRGYWVVSADRCRQTVFQRSQFEGMEKQAAP